jgi:hypothetical protein
VAGGIEITPALAILRDVLCRYQADAPAKQLRCGNPNHGMSNVHDWSALPRSIAIYHCIRRPEDLHVLDYICPRDRQMLLGYNALGLDVQVHVYVTSRPSDHQRAAADVVDDPAAAGRIRQQIIELTASRCSEQLRAAANVVDDLAGTADRIRQQIELTTRDEDDKPATNIILPKGEEKYIY